jgi:hypothetical protein
MGDTAVCRGGVDSGKGWEVARCDRIGLAGGERGAWPAVAGGDRRACGGLRRARINGVGEYIQYSFSPRVQTIQPFSQSKNNTAFLTKYEQYSVSQINTIARPPRGGGLVARHPLATYARPTRSGPTVAAPHTYRCMGSRGYRGVIMGDDQTWDAVLVPVFFWVFFGWMGR